MFKIAIVFISLSLPIFVCWNSAFNSPKPSVQDESIEKILRSYIDDFKKDRFAQDACCFGIKVPGHGEWTVQVEGKKQDEMWGVSLRAGQPNEPTFIYKVEPETLRAIDSGAINAMTAQGKSFADDYTPMSIVHMEGYEPTVDEAGAINPFSFHFWTRGFPEIIPFRDIETRKAHGSNFGVFFYQPGLRTGWYRVEPRERVHEGPRERAMPFPILAIATVGITEGEVDGERVSLGAGNAVLIPANAEHKWWNESTEPSEAILVMFGEGA